MKRWIAFFCACILWLCASAQAEAAHEVLYFYENYCASCTPEEDFYDSFERLTGFPLSECAYSSYNIARKDGRAKFESVADKLHLTNPSVPMVVVDGVAYSGASEMQSRLPVDALSWGGETDSTIVYLYVPACESCARAVEVLDALPSMVTLLRGNVEIESNVLIERIDVSARPEVARQLFEAYDVPDDLRITPCVFLADRYLSGADTIERDLPSMVNLGWAVGCVDLPASETDGDSSALSLVGTLGAGLVAGLNTCALSMLLLFLSIVLDGKQRAGWLTVCFLGAKFVCYLLIGFVLLGVMQRFNPHWLQPLAKGVLTGMGAILIALNLWDAYQAHRENFGKIRNQLPAGLRSRLHRAIRAITNTRVLVPATIALGFVVALGEFLCAGQLYLMQLLSKVQSGTASQALNLVAYCLAFIAPSALLCALALRGGSQVRMSSFLAEHMAIAKLITAAAMLLLILSAWLV